MASFYDTYTKRTAENEQSGMRDLQQMGSLVQLQQTMKARQDEQELKSMLQQSGGDLEAVVKGALKAGRPDVAAKLAPLIEAQRKAQPQAQTIGAGGLLRPDGTIVPPQERPNTQVKAAPARKRIDGEIEIHEELQPDGSWKEIGRGPRFSRQPPADKTYPIVHTADGIYERRPEGLVLLRGPDGKPLVPTVRERPITEYQGKNALYGSRAKQADDALLMLEDKINTVGLATKQGAEGIPVVGGALGMLGNKMLSANQQRVEQAQRNFVNAVLRQESGAVISDAEFANAKKQYFPQPGDTPEVIKQKRQNRITAIDGFKRIAGAAWPDAPSAASGGGWKIEEVK